MPRFERVPTGYRVDSFFFTFQMDLSLPKIYTEIPDFLLGDLWTLPEKLKNVSLYVAGKPLGGLPF